MADSEHEPRLAPVVVERSGSTPTLEELLEQASRSQSVRFGSGTLVGECLDTHNPHLPRRVFVRAHDDGGEEVCAWLPMLADLRVRPGHKVLLSKPANWPEPVVMGVLAGLETPDTNDGAEPETTDASSGKVVEQPTLSLERGQALVITNADGQPLLRLAASEAGARVELLQDEVAFEMPGRLRIGAERIELHSRAGGVDIRSEGDTIVRSRFIRLN